MDIDEAGSNDAPRRIDHPGRPGPRNRGARHERDAASLDRDIGPKARRAGTVQDGAAGDQEIIRRLLPGRRESQRGQE
jgi:hypothetical protein